MIWGQEFDLHDTYGQIALDLQGMAGAVAQIPAQPTAQQDYSRDAVGSEEVL